MGGVSDIWAPGTQLRCETLPLLPAALPGVLRLDALAEHDLKCRRRGKQGHICMEGGGAVSDRRMVSLRTGRYCLIPGPVCSPGRRGLAPPKQNDLSFFSADSGAVPQAKALRGLSSRSCACSSLSSSLCTEISSKCSSWVQSGGRQTVPTTCRQVSVMGRPAKGGRRTQSCAGACQFQPVEPMASATVQEFGSVLSMDTTAAARACVHS